MRIDSLRKWWQSRHLLSFFGEFGTPHAYSKMGIPSPCSNPRHLSTYNIGRATNVAWHEGGVPREEKERSLRQKGAIIWFTGLSGSGE